MDQSLDSQFFKGNRDKLLNGLKSQVLICTANGLLQSASDEAQPFTQDPNFWYLTGLSEPDLILVKSKEEEFIIVPKFYIRRQSVTEPLNKEGLKKTSGIDQILDESEGWLKIKNTLANQKQYATFVPLPILMKRHGLYSNPSRRQLVLKIKRISPKASIEDARKQIARQRMVKQPVEIKLIQKAIDITDDTLKEVLARDNLAKYTDTGQIERDILSGFISKGAAGHAFDPVVASGGNAALIHFPKLFQPLKEGELVVCDVGSNYSFYKADITRTVAYGQPTPRQMAVYQAVKDVQSEAFKLIKAGMDYLDYENKVTNLVGEQLIKLGLIKKLNKKAIRKYYMTYCSHSLGLSAHDSADFSIKLPKDVIMTVEPGIYIQEENIGVRIEDVVQITESGCKILSSSLPTRLNI